MPGDHEPTDEERADRVAELATSLDLRVAAAANDQGREPAMNIGFRTGAFVGMATVGLGLLGASLVVLPLAMFAFAGPLMALTRRAAETLLDPTLYVQAVLR